MVSRQNASAAHLNGLLEFHIEPAVCILHQLLCCDTLPGIYHYTDVWGCMLHSVHGTPVEVQSHKHFLLQVCHELPRQCWQDNVAQPSTSRHCWQTAYHSTRSPPPPPSAKGWKKATVPCGIKSPRVLSKGSFVTAACQSSCVQELPSRVWAAA